MADIINLKQDIPSIYKSEGSQYATLVVSILTTTGSGSWTSTSSGTVYNYTAGLQDLFNQLDIVLSDYRISSVDWNLIRSFIYGQGTPMVDGIQTKLVKVNGVLSEVQLLKADLTTLMAKTVLNRVNGSLDSVDTIIYDDTGLIEICKYKDTLVKINGSLDHITRTIQV